jgi:hypothetical protein
MPKLLCAWTLLIVGLVVGKSVALQQPRRESESNQPKFEVLARGPLHEAFAKVTLYDPKPGPIVEKEPPPVIEEVPPDTKPEGDYRWIPGYWAWDDDRKDFIWVSGVWRIPPPGRAWIPGYWTQTDKGYQWVSGYWGPDDTATIEYLPQPPPSLERGPNSPAPGSDFFWTPGCWVWRGGRYVWRPGFWTANHDDWVWVPSHYVWTPTGYVFVNGHWDYTLDYRGCVFAPVYFYEPVYYRRSFRFIPEILIRTSSLSIHLFHRPYYGSYYFGDYYDPYYLRFGIYPWFSFWERGYGYDPLFVYFSWYHGRHSHRQDWSEDISREYRRRAEHADLRPARTFAADRERAGRGVRNGESLTSPINEAVQSKAVPLPMETLNNTRRSELARAVGEVRDLTARRREVEAKGRTTPVEKSSGPRRVELSGASILSSSRPAGSPDAAPRKTAPRESLAPSEKGQPQRSAKEKSAPPAKPSPATEKRIGPPVEKRISPDAERKPAPPERKSGSGASEKPRPKTDSSGAGGGRSGDKRGGSKKGGR